MIAKSFIEINNKTHAHAPGVGHYKTDSGYNLMTKSLYKRAYRY